MFALSRFPHTHKLSFAACTFALLLAAGSVNADEGITASSIKLGQSAPLSGALAQLGSDYRDGAILYFKHVNAQGGVHGRKIELVTLDDAYIVERTIENTKKLLQDEKVFSLFNMFGTGNTRAALPLATEARTPIFSAYSGAEGLRASENKFIFHTRASYAEETEQLILQGLTFGLKTVAIAYQDNDFGKAALKSAEESAVRNQVVIVGRIAVDVNSRDIEVAADKVAALRPQSVLVLTAGKSGVDFMSAYRHKNPNTWLMALSVVSSKELVKVMGENSRGIIISQVVPTPWTPQGRAVKDYQKLMESSGKNKEDYSYAALEGFISAKVFVEALKRVGPKLSREKLMATLESSGPFDVGDFSVSYGSGKRAGTKFVDATMIGGGGKFIR